MNFLYIDSNALNTTFPFCRVKFPTGKAIRDAVLLGKRLTARDSLELQLVDLVTKQDSLNTEAAKLLHEVLGKYGLDRTALGQNKADVYSFDEVPLVDSASKL